MTLNEMLCVVSLVARRTNCPESFNNASTPVISLLLLIASNAAPTLAPRSIIVEPNWIFEPASTCEYSSSPVTAPVTVACCFSTWDVSPLTVVYVPVPITRPKSPDSTEKLRPAEPALVFLNTNFPFPSIKASTPVVAELALIVAMAEDIFPLKVMLFPLIFTTLSKISSELLTVFVAVNVVFELPYFSSCPADT